MPQEPKKRHSRQRQGKRRAATAIFAANYFLADRLVPHQPEEIADLANETSRQVATALGVNQENLATAKPDQVTKWQTLIGENQDITFWLRHLTQEDNSQTKALFGAEKKIAQMLPESNRTDTGTVESIIDAVTTAVVIRSIINGLPKSQRKVVLVETSENKRAALGAHIIAKILGASSEYNTMLNCPDYRTDLTPEEINEKLGESNGSLPFDQAIINDVCGEGTYEGITTAVNGMLEKGEEDTLPEEYKKIGDQNGVLLVRLTHTQHFNSLQQRGNLPITRPRELAGLATFADKMADLQEGVF